MIRAKKYVNWLRRGHSGVIVQLPVVQVAFSPGPENAPTLMNVEAKPQRQEIVQKAQIVQRYLSGRNGVNVQSLVAVALKPEPKNA